MIRKITTRQLTLLGIDLKELGVGSDVEMFKILPGPRD